MLSHQRNFIIISSFRSPLRFVSVFMRARKLVYCERSDVSLVEHVSRQVQRLSCCRLWLECMWRNSTLTTFIIRLLHLTKHFIIFYTSYYCECVSIAWLLKNNTSFLQYKIIFHRNINPIFQLQDFSFYCLQVRNILPVKHIFKCALQQILSLIIGCYKM